MILVGSEWRHGEVVVRVTEVRKDGHEGNAYGIAPCVHYKADGPDSREYCTTQETFKLYWRERFA